MSDRGGSVLRSPAAASFRTGHEAAYYRSPEVTGLRIAVGRRELLPEAPGQVKEGGALLTQTLKSESVMNFGRGCVAFSHIKQLFHFSWSLVPFGRALALHRRDPFCFPSDRRGCHPGEFRGGKTFSPRLMPETEDRIGRPVCREKRRPCHRPRTTQKRCTCWGR